MVMAECVKLLVSSARDEGCWLGSQLQRSGCASEDGADSACQRLS